MSSRTAFVLLLLVGAGCRDDGGDTDAGAGDRCTVDEDCDDGAFCTGAEICDPGSRNAGADGCVDGPMPCPTATCDEGSDSCGMGCSDPDADADGFDSVECGGTDCDDARAEVNPSATEVCDVEGADEDCEPTTFGGLDRDGDGFVDARCCNGDACGDDCDDGRASTSPLAPEVCDGFDNDCDATVDEGATIMAFADEDRDLYGDPARPIESCPGWPGVSTSPMDCDDTNPDVHSARPEIMDGIDNDCDEAVDETPVATAWYPDEDGDGFGANDSARAIVVFGRPEGYSQLFSDCDDRDASRNPSAEELCNAIDDDCTPATRFSLGPNDSEDDDGDGYPDPACPGVDGARADCDETRADVYPGAFESCDGEDEDCDGVIDEACATPTDAGAGDGGLAPDGGPADAGGPRCPPEGCRPPFPSTGADGDLILTGTMELTLDAGVYDYDRIELGPNTVLRTNGTGVLELRARSEVIIRGQIDLAGGDGAAGRESSCIGLAGGGGGNVGRSGDAGRAGGCGLGGRGGLGDEGGRGEGSCPNGGFFGGGAGALSQAGQAGGGGGGYAGGGGGASRAGTEARGGSGARELVSTMGGDGGSMLTPAQGGRTTIAVYDGADGQPRGGSGSCAYGGGGGGGSIGEAAALDRAVSSTFRPGSGGGGGGDGIYTSGLTRCAEGAGGGGGGGALRIASHESIIITNTARLSVAGGAGGRGAGVSGVVSSGGGAGGGGSGGVIYLASPAIRIDSGSLIDAGGGAGGDVVRTCGISGAGRGGAGGMGRIRLSVEPTTCTVTASTMPPMPAAGCVPNSTPGEVHVGAYPN